MIRRWFLAFLVFLTLTGCATVRDMWNTLPPSLCKPAVDLPQMKAVEVLPEVATMNDEFFALFLRERAAHAKDVQDYNSLYHTCVVGGVDGRQ